MSKHSAPPSAEAHVTPREVFLNRRSFLAGAAGLGLASALGSEGHAAAFSPVKSPFSTDQAPNTLEEISTYNNFYEFGTGKSDPSANAGSLTTKPWMVEVGGLVAKPKMFGIEELLKFPIEERIYRHRCVEAWSMIIPWNGFPLAELLKKVEPLGTAKYVAFQTLKRPSEMPDQASYFPAIDYPYVEGLRLDEAMHPLTLMAVGLYGDIIPNQNGAPIRLVVPWKYGFKGIKSIVRITLTDTQPPTSWNKLQSNEYGFYANVNPQVDHPRWSQASERVIGAGLIGGRKDTLMFNGYADQVAGLYAGMDLKANY